MGDFASSRHKYWMLPELLRAGPCFRHSLHNPFPGLSASDPFPLCPAADALKCKHGLHLRGRERGCGMEGEDPDGAPQCKWRSRAR